MYKLLHEEKNYLSELKEMTGVNRITDEDLIKELNVGSGLGQVIVRLSQGEATIAGIAAGLAIIALAVQAASRISVSKECKDFRYGTPGHKKCEINVKIKKEQTKLAVIKSKGSLCKNSKDPEKCNAKLQQKVAQINAKIAKLKGQL